MPPMTGSVSKDDRKRVAPGSLPTCIIHDDQIRCPCSSLKYLIFQCSQTHAPWPENVPLPFRTIRSPKSREVVPEQTGTPQHQSRTVCSAACSWHSSRPASVCPWAHRMALLQKNDRYGHRVFGMAILARRPGLYSGT